MTKIDSNLTRRAFLRTAAYGAVGSTLRHEVKLKAEKIAFLPLFDGKTLNGWIQAQNSSTAFSSEDMMDPASLGSALIAKSEAVPAFLADQLTDALKTALASYSTSGGDASALKGPLARNLTKIIAGDPLYDASRFQNVALRPRTLALARQDLHGRDLVMLNRLLLEDAFPTQLAKTSPSGWIVEDGSMASTGTGRGVIYTERDFTRYRLMFTMRHVYGNPDHQACVLIFCMRPQAEEIALDALGGIQFQVPNGGHWDYRPGKNTAGGSEFTLIQRPEFDPRQWSRVELLVNAATGKARMAVAQPPGNKAVEVLSFNDPTAGKTGPIALQMHNGGLFDEYKDVDIEINPQTDDLIRPRVTGQ
jgi:hypothetical protein